MTSDQEKAFLDTTLKAKQTKENSHKLHLTKTENFFASKDTIKKVKRQPTEWEKIFANHRANMGLVSRMHKNTIQ